MAQPTIDEEITRLEAALIRVRDKIVKQEAFRALEEGGSATRFRTEFTNIEILYQQESYLTSRLSPMYAYKARI